MTAQVPRGLRNANPGNIRLSSVAWQGEAATQSDKDFVVFSAPEWGIRAMAKILLNYQAKGLVTVRQMIGRWAPTSENDTASYVAHVAAAMGVGPDDPVYLHDLYELGQMVRAIITHENGVQPYPPEMINKGVGLALHAVAI